MSSFETKTVRTQRGNFSGKASRKPEYGRKIRSFRKEDEEGAEVYYRPGKFAVVKGKEMREFSYDTKQRGSRAGARAKALKCAGEWCGMKKSDDVEIMMKPENIADHDKWEKAKAAADKQEDVDDYYALVNSIYQKMGGKFKSMKKANDDLGLSTMDIDAAVRQAASIKWGVRSYVERVYPDAETAIVCIYPDAPMYGGPYSVSSETKKVTLRVPFEISEDGEVELGESEEVKQVYVAMKKCLTELAKNVEEYGADDATFSALVEAKLEEQDLTIDDLAQRTGIDEDKLQDMLDGDEAWSRGDKLRVAGACGIEVKEYMKKEVVFRGRATEGGYVFGYDEDLEKALENAGEECEELIGEGLLFLRKEVTKSEIEVRCDVLAKDKDEHGYGSYPKGEGGGSKKEPKEKKQIVGDMANEIRAKGTNRLKSRTYHTSAKNHTVELKQFQPHVGAGDEYGDTTATHVVTQKYGDKTKRHYFDDEKTADTFAREQARGSGMAQYFGVGVPKVVKKSVVFPGIRLPHTNSFYFSSNGESASLAKALHDSGACKSAHADPDGVTVEFEKKIEKDDVEVVCEKLDTVTLGAGAEMVPRAKMNRKKRLNKSLSEEIALLKADTEELIKAKELGIVYGVAFEPDKVDLQGEYTTDDLRKVAAEFMKNPVVRIQHGKLSKNRVVFNYVTEKGDRILGKEWTPGTWILGVQLDEEGKKLYKAGKITGFSMGGTKRFAVN